MANDISWDEASRRAEAYQQGRQDAIDYDGSPEAAGPNPYTDPTLAQRYVEGWNATVDELPWAEHIARR